MEINGKTIANEILADLTQRVTRLQQTAGIIPRLAVIRVGDDPAITSYINQKVKMAKTIGAEIDVYQYPETVTESILLENIDSLQKVDKVDGLLIQLPMPAHLNAEKLINAVHPDKDVDGFHPRTKSIVPVAGAVMSILEKIYENDPQWDDNDFFYWLKAKYIVVLGKGKTGGKPIIDLLKQIHCTIHIIDSKTENKEELTQQADIIISAVGKREAVTPEMIKQGVILIGVGLNRDEHGIFGDYDEEKIKSIASYYTPSPGGVGPVNVAKLMENLVLAAEKRS